MQNTCTPFHSIEVTFNSLASMSYEYALLEVPNRFLILKFKLKNAKIVWMCKCLLVLFMLSSTLIFKLYTLKSAPDWVNIDVVLLCHNHWNVLLANCFCHFTCCFVCGILTTIRNYLEGIIEISVWQSIFQNYNNGNVYHYFKKTYLPHRFLQFFISLNV
jgi:hypothetical protein